MALGEQLGLRMIDRKIGQFLFLLIPAAPEFQPPQQRMRREWREAVRGAEAMGYKEH